jgi:hypothetical protein
VLLCASSVELPDMVESPEDGTAAYGCGTGGSDCGSITLPDWLCKKEEEKELWGVEGAERR